MQKIRLNGPQRKDAVSGAKISETYKESWMATRQPPQDVQESDRGERQNLVLELGNGEGFGGAGDIFYERCEQGNSDLAEVDKKFDTEFGYMEKAMENAKEAQNLAMLLSEGFPCMHKLITATNGDVCDWNGRSLRTRLFAKRLDAAYQNALIRRQG